jgi:hypothetical protein
MRTVSLAEMDMEVKVNEAAVDVERKRATVVAEQKAVTQQEEEKRNIEARMTAERVREVTLTARTSVPLARGPRELAGVDGVT